VLVAAGESDLLEALKAIRAMTDATVVLKRGAMGCIVYDGAIGDDLEQGIVGKGFPIEIYNVLGAGDAFMSGFLRGWLKGESHQTSATWANACGAFAVSRLLCAPEYPSWTELDHFLNHGSKQSALRKDEDDQPPPLGDDAPPSTWPRSLPSPSIIAKQLEDIAGDKALTASRSRCWRSRRPPRVADGRPGFGMLLDDKYGRDAMFEVPKSFWIARPVELPGSRPLRFEFSQDIGSRLVEWPVDHCIKVLCFWHPDDPRGINAGQQRQAADRLTTPAARSGATADRDHRRQGRPLDDRHHRPRPRGALRRRA
jgi:5-dehydro-2-deoxygluconokinase